MGGASADSLTFASALAVVAAALVLLFRSRPRLAVLSWVLTIAFVPYWAGVSVGLYLPPATAVGVLVLTALLWREPVLLRLPDVVVAVVVLVVGCSYALGLVALSALFAVVMEWGLAYAVARLASTVVGSSWIYLVVAVVMAVVAALAVIEFLTSVNAFTQVPGPGPREGWASLQTRGGVLRAEGAFGHSIALGATLGLAVPLAVCAPLRPRTRLVIVAIIVAGTVVSFSRIGMAAAGIGLVLCVVLLGKELGSKVRWALATVVALAGAAAVPLLGRVFDAAGDEAVGSAAYRGDLLQLVPTMQVLGTAESAERTADGVLRFGGFRSIDSAIIYTGLVYGWFIAALLAALLVAAVVAVMRPAAVTGSTIAVVALVPAVLSVAFITQYAAFFWFVAGLAVSDYAGRVTPWPVGDRAMRRQPSTDLVDLAPPQADHAAVPWIGAVDDGRGS